VIPATEALERLREGNRRFVDGRHGLEAGITRTRREALVAGQEPFAVVLGCSDSRVPVEIVFDQGLGDLFVIRVAGNVAAAPEAGSVEFAAGKLGARLVVVLGHTHCGAVTATVDALQHADASASPNLRSIVDRIRPAMEPLLGMEPHADREALIREGVRRQPAAPWLPNAGASDRGGRLAGGRRRVLPGKRRSRVLRRRTGTRLSAPPVHPPPAPGPVACRLRPSFMTRIPLWNNAPQRVRVGL